MSVGIFLFGIGTLALFLWYFATDLDRRKRLIGTVLTAAVAGFSAWAAIPLSEKLPLAIDLQGGSSFVVEIQPATEGRAVTLSQQETAVEILRKRLDPDGGKNLIINPQGVNQLEVQMPGVKDEEMAQVRETIQKVALLEFRLVQPGKFPYTKEPGEEPAFEPGWVERPIIKELQEGETQEELDARPQQYLSVKNRVQVAGKRVENAGVIFDGQWQISLTLDDEGGEQMYEITRSAQHGSDQLAILIDGEILSHPRINSTLRSNISITGQFSEQEAFDLASALENPLENPLKIVSSSQISPAYGAKTIERGIFAGLTGLGLTLLFMIIFYRLAGLVALIGLTVNVLFLFGFMCVFKFTLSMPGIAGIVLTIGVAVDANVLIYERLREEMKAGRTLKSAIQAAYEKAFSAIFDANVTTLITATIMFMVASGSIKGFAMTLTVGVLGSLFAALLVTRVCFNWMTGSDKLSKLSMSRMIPEKVYDFLGKRKTAFYFSVVAVAGSLIWLGVKNTDALAYDLNPKGGDKISITGADLTNDQILDSLKDLSVFNNAGVFNTEGNGDKINFFPPTIQTQTTAAGDDEIIVRAEFGTGNAIKGELEKDFPEMFPTGNENSTAGIGVEEIGPSMSATLLRESFLALGLGLLGILIYLTFRFEVAFALGAIVALSHDIIISIGIMTLLGTQVSVMMIGAFLTIAGYSINDTIVVFDRIRETLRTRKGELKDIMNLAISETLGRTLITSMTTLLTCTCLALFGGPVLREFSIAIIVGILVGTYSSIFVAAPLVLWWAQRKEINLRQDILDADQAKIIQHGIEKEVSPRES